MALLWIATIGFGCLVPLADRAATMEEPSVGDRPEHDRVGPGVSSNALAGGRAIIPDLTQTDPAGGFAAGGRSHCGPVAVSNSLMALFADRLTESGMATQYDVVNRLASGPYMNTDPAKGTGVDGLIRGLRHLLETDLTENDWAILYEGWREHRHEFSSDRERPCLDAIGSAVDAGGAAWLNLGWYRIDETNDVYERRGGHWVTVVDVEPRESDPDEGGPVVVIHDPAPRAGTEPARERVAMLRLESGTLAGADRRLPRQAAGYYRMAGGMHIKRGMDCAILDGAVVLQPQPDKPTPTTNSSNPANP